MLIIRQDQMDALGANPVQGCPLRATWVQIELVGEDDLPLAGEAFRLVLPDGTVHEGTLDDRGTARLDGVRAGRCAVSFPRLDADAWEPC